MRRNILDAYMVGPVGIEPTISRLKGELLASLVSDPKNREGALPLS